MRNIIIPALLAIGMSACPNGERSQQNLKNIATARCPHNTKGEPKAGTIDHHLAKAECFDTDKDGIVDIIRLTQKRSGVVRCLNNKYTSFQNDECNDL